LSIAPIGARLCMQHRVIRCAPIAAKGSKDDDGWLMMWWEIPVLQELEEEIQATSMVEAFVAQLQVEC
jgi:hypothetical protein